MTFLFPFGVVVLVLCGFIGHAMGLPGTGLLFGIALVGGMIYFLGG